MNIYQKFSLIVATLIACSNQISPAKAVTVSTPYASTLNGNEASPANSNQVPTMANVLNNCNPNGTQAGIGGTNNGNTGKGATPGDTNGGGPSGEPVPEPTTIAGASLAIAFGGWWKKKTASKMSKNSSEV
ncbi:hypothetical protein BCD67_12315 [Oscillatoriales cyanobacterium USR001]|nr:hypothetical protein BCD67_12315 [Oscillatoriales cyanobacterium USR001]